MSKILLGAVAIVGGSGMTCFEVQGKQSRQSKKQGNVLVVVADDLGKEVLSLDDSPAAHQAVTPNLDGLMQRGLIFDNMWGSPLSSPARAAMLTGRYGYHTGIVSLEITLPLEEQTIFEALPEGYSNALFGKWHLSTNTDFAPSYGIDHFVGLASGGGVRDYRSWRLTEGGESRLTTDYITTKITDLAIDWIDNQRDPWFCWVAYTAPHTPYHLPPSGTHTRTQLTGTAEDIEQNTLQYYLAMIENLDYELGRLLASVDDNTTIIFVGDNGTENGVLQSPYPFRHGKGSVYQPGVSIPLIVSGRGVTSVGERCNAAVDAVDIFPTVMELMGQPMSRYEDGYSFVATLSGGEGQRTYSFSEIVHQRMGYTYALNDGRYKVISVDNKITMLFDLERDPLEEHNLLQGDLSDSAKEAFDRLSKQLESMEIPPIESSTTNTNLRERGVNRNSNNNNNIRSRR
ncbi:MAG: sulfatase-like hydrolase/transferase [Rikenellaceae bacterium]